MAFGLVCSLAACSSESTQTAPTPAAIPTPPPTTVALATTTPSTVPPTTLRPREECVTTVGAGESFGVIINRIDRAEVTIDTLLSENGLTADDVIHPNDELDICVGNDIDDVTGASRLAPSVGAVTDQQLKLNDLFAPYIIAELKVDGDSGRMTRQMLCAARLLLGLPANMNHLDPASEEATAIMGATSLQSPADAQTWASKWILIDRTCQILIAGEQESIVDIYPTSTGQPGYPTHPVQSAAAYRFDPAVDNGGWHDSSTFPSAVDDPNNGNMYKPLYFNGGQAIHGANYVPPEPRSKGCARTFPWHQDQLLSWIGIGGRTEVTWNANDIGVIVTVQGNYRELIES